MAVNMLFKGLVVAYQNQRCSLAPALTGEQIDEL
jgi:hypothetical protein